MNQPPDIPSESPLGRFIDELRARAREADEHAARTIAATSEGATSRIEYAEKRRSAAMQALEAYIGKLDQVQQERDELRRHVAALRGVILAVLCDPEGAPCFHGSDGDRKAIADVLAQTAAPET